MFKFLSHWPPVSREASDIERLYGKSPLGIDLEFSGDRPTILGISDGETHVSVPYHDGRPYLIELLETYPDTKIVGHNLCAADFPLLVADGIPLRLEQIEDTILWWWLTNPHLSKGTGKLEEDGDDRRGRGFNSLGVMASVHTDFPNWKNCREKDCVGPCPDHDEHWYNGIDAAAPVIALPKMQRVARLRGVDKLYPLHRDLSVILAQMRDFGVRIDVPYVYGIDRHPLGCLDGSSLHEQFLAEKQEIERTLPFNPKSPKQVVEYFKAQKIRLTDAQEETVREYIEEHDDASEELVSLLDYKELGNGVDRWFEPQYRDPKTHFMEGYLDLNGYIHPRLNIFTSSGRFACSSPNLQNVSKRRKSRRICECGAAKESHPTSRCASFKGESVGKKVRRAIIAPEGWYIFKGDLSNAENRVALHFGGYTIKRGVDLHAWVRDLAGITEDMEISLREGNAREAAKKIQHANNNLEGLQLKTAEELRSPKMRKEIAAGARKVHWDWTFQGKIVTFSGSYEAQRTFGSATYENRKRVLDVNEKYTNAFPGVIDFRKRVSKSCEENSAIITPLGYCILSYGYENDRMKIAQSIWQQQVVAHITKLALVTLWRRWEAEGLMRPVLQVHDELVCYVRNDVDPSTASEWFREAMEIEQPEIPGLIIPCDMAYGSNWRDCNKIGT